MKKIHDVTLVSVGSIKIEETLYALRYSMSKIQFAQSIFLTSAPIKQSFKDINIESIPEISSVDEYSKFIIYDLHNYLNTSHCLIVQWDGFVINERMWSDEFLNYDYIGAAFKRRKEDPAYASDNHGKFYDVGNGGFSLRSKSLLEAPSSLGLVRPDWSKSHNEDGFFCVEHRALLESIGYSWAPKNVADRFSIECGLRDKNYLKRSFGFHGKRLLQRHKFLGRWNSYGY